MSDLRPRQDGQARCPSRPLLSLEECANVMGLTHEQAKYLHENAIIKIRAALVAYGYKKNFEGRLRR